MLLCRYKGDVVLHYKEFSADRVCACVRWLRALPAPLRGFGVLCWLLLLWSAGFFDVYFIHSFQVWLPPLRGKFPLETDPQGIVIFAADPPSLEALRPARLHTVEEAAAASKRAAAPTDRGATKMPLFDKAAVYAAVQEAAKHFQGNHSPESEADYERQ